ncbi:MAG: phosphotransferase family protein [Promethearchaeota archaeon]
MDIKEPQVLEICRKCDLEYESFELLGRGAFNINYLLHTKQGKYVLRVENNIQFQNLEKEYEILKTLDGRFGPKVYLFDNSKKIIPRDFLIEEFIVGEHPTECTDDFIQTMGKWYKRLHQIKAKLTDLKEPRFSIKRTFETYTYNPFHKNKCVLDDDLRNTLEPLFERALTIVQKNDKLFSRRTHFSLIHGDPTRFNIFYQKGSVRLVDWEFAQYYLRELDLAFFVWSYELDDKKKMEFLHHTGYPSSQFAMKQFEIIYLVHCLDMLVWRIDRLRLIFEGKIDKRQKGSTKEEMMEGIYEDIPKIKSSLENPVLFSL